MKWNAAGCSPHADFFYVSASPWQLYRPLEAFREAHGFPPGPWHLKHLRFKNPATVRALIGPQIRHKLGAIAPLLERWPRRPLALVGDSGEQDPEIFGRIGRHPHRTVRTFIRNVTGEPRGARRYHLAFDGIHGEKWQIFDAAAELPHELPA
jgi:phosphatidate phosphatase APP1